MNLTEFLRKYTKEQIGRVDDDTIIANVNGWIEKGVLTAADLEEVNTLIEEKNNPPEVEEEFEFEDSFEEQDNI